MSDQAVTKSDLNDIDAKQQKQINRLTYSLAALFVLNIITLAVAVAT